jgi:hypothetical protein
MTSLPVFQSIEAEKRTAGPPGPDEDAFAGRFSGVAPGDAIPRKNAIAKVPISRAGKIPNAEQTLL